MLKSLFSVDASFPFFNDSTLWLIILIECCPTHPLSWLSNSSEGVVVALSLLVGYKDRHERVHSLWSLALAFFVVFGSLLSSISRFEALKLCGWVGVTLIVGKCQEKRKGEKKVGRSFLFSTLLTIFHNFNMCALMLKFKNMI